MKRVLVIDRDRAAAQTLGLACLEQAVGVAIADNVCEGVRVLLDTQVDLIVVEASDMRLTAREMATLFERVAPGVRVVVTMRPEAALERRVALELAGFAVLPKPVTAEDLLHKVAATGCAMPGRV